MRKSEMKQKDDLGRQMDLFERSGEELEGGTAGGTGEGVCACAAVEAVVEPISSDGRAR